MSISTYPLRKRLIDIAEAEIGTVEYGTSNTGKRVVQYQASTDLGGTGWPWCAAFVCWCIRRWLDDEEVRDALKIKLDIVDTWRPRTAAAFGFHEWARTRRLLIMDDNPAHVLHTADLVTYDFSHIGIVKDDRDDLIYTIEGNTDGQGGRDGGGVWAKTRPRSMARRFIRMLP